MLFPYLCYLYFIAVSPSKIGLHEREGYTLLSRLKSQVTLKIYIIIRLENIRTKISQRHTKKERKRCITTLQKLITAVMLGMIRAPLNHTIRY